MPISFDDVAKKRLVENSFESVSLLQEACRIVCEREGVYETQKENKVVGSEADIGALMRHVVDEQAGRYMAFLTNFAEGFQQTEYDMYRWLIYAVLRTPADELETGIRRTAISRIIKEKHPAEKLNEGNITQALQNAASLQVNKSIHPIILDYDQTTRVLSVVDRSFLVWLQHQNPAALVDELGIED